MIGRWRRQGGQIRGSDCALFLLLVIFENSRRCLASIAPIWRSHSTSAARTSFLGSHQVSALEGRRRPAALGLLIHPSTLKPNLCGACRSRSLETVLTTQVKKKPRVFEPASSAYVHQPVSGVAAAVHLSGSGEDGSRQLESCCGLKRAFLTPAR